MPAKIDRAFVDFVENAFEPCSAPASSPEVERTVNDKKTTNFGANAILAHVYAEWHRKRGMKPPPFHCEVCPTSKCPIHCQFCSYTERNRARHHLSKKILDEIAEDLKEMGTLAVYGSGGGDPLASDETVAFIDKVAAFSSVAIQTNAACLHKLQKWGCDWFNNRVDLVSWSVYADNPRTFQEVCGSNEKVFATIESNVRKTVEFRDSWRHCGLPSVPPHLSAKIVLSRGNFRRVVNMLRYARSFCPDTIHICLVDDFEPGQSVALTSSDLVELCALLDGEDDEQLVRLRKRIDGRENLVRSFIPNHTVLDGQTAIIETDGSVYVSIPSDGNPNYVIGNVNELRLRELWWGPRHRDVVSRLARVAFPINRDRHYSRDVAVEDFLRGRSAFPLRAADLTVERLRADLRVQI